MCVSSAAARLHFANTLATLSKADVSDHFIEGAALAASNEEVHLREAEAELELVAALATEETNRLNLTRAEIARDEAITSATHAKAQALIHVTESETRRVARVEMISNYNNAALEDENAANAMVAELLVVQKAAVAKEKATNYTCNENLLPAAAAVVTEGTKAKAATTYYNGLREVLAAAVL